MAEAEAEAETRKRIAGSENSASEDTSADLPAKRARAASEPIVIEDTGSDDDVQIVGGVGPRGHPCDNLFDAEDDEEGDDEDEEDDDDDDLLSDEEDEDEDAVGNEGLAHLPFNPFSLPLNQYAHFLSPEVEDQLIRRVWSSAGANRGAAGQHPLADFQQRAELLRRILQSSGQHSGVSAAALERGSLLQTLTEKDAARLNEGRGNCVVCLEQFEAAQLVRRLQCLCVFHKECVDRHFAENEQCPVCRTSVTHRHA